MLAASNEAWFYSVSEEIANILPFQQGVSRQILHTIVIMCFFTKRKSSGYEEVMDASKAN